MAGFAVEPRDEAFVLQPHEIIVSKTDLKGHIRYANEVFCRAAEIDTRQTLGSPHSLIRHPDMPRCIFKLMWETIESGREIFAYVKNMTASGKYYWVLAHVTPSFDAKGNVDGYHSNRRAVDREKIAKIEALYRELRVEERRHTNRKDGLQASWQLLHKRLEDVGKTYEEFIWIMQS